MLIDLAHIASAARALASAALPPLDDEAAGLRLAICQACEHRWLGDAERFDPVGWCRRCGCGSGPRAALSRKARLRGARCPIGRWPADNDR